MHVELNARVKQKGIIILKGPINRKYFLCGPITLVQTPDHCTCDDPGLHINFHCPPSLFEHFWAPNLSLGQPSSPRRLLKLLMATDFGVVFVKRLRSSWFRLEESVGAPGSQSCEEKFRENNSWVHPLSRLLLTFG